jgi:hypothetical protein
MPHNSIEKVENENEIVLLLIYLHMLKHSQDDLILHGIDVKIPASLQYHQ